MGKKGDGYVDKYRNDLHMVIYALHQAATIGQECFAYYITPKVVWTQPTHAFHAHVLATQRPDTYEFRAAHMGCSEV